MLRNSVIFSTILASLLSLDTTVTIGQTITSSIDGFQYGATAAPKGNEWESPQLLSLNKELPHASFFSFQNVESARKVLPEHSNYWLSLNGSWKFNWVKTRKSDQRTFMIRIIMWVPGNLFQSL